jgi:DNA-binding CsgD family transcriptional regulator
MRKNNKIISPLKLLNIDIFFNIRICNDKYFILSNNTAISKHLYKTGYIGNFLKKIIADSTYGNMSVKLCRDVPDNDFMSYVKKFTVDDILIIVLPYADYFDIFAFASSVHPNLIQSLSINKLGIFKKYIIFFKLNSRRIIKTQSNFMHNLKYPISRATSKIRLQNNYKDSLKDFEMLILKHKLQKFNDNLNSKLTAKDIDYIASIIHNTKKSTIADQNDISLRGVDSAFERIKQKTGYSSKSEFINLFFKNGNNFGQYQCK